MVEQDKLVRERYQRVAFTPDELRLLLVLVGVHVMVKLEDKLMQPFEARLLAKLSRARNKVDGVPATRLEG